MFTIKTRVGESKYAVVKAFDRLMKKCKYPMSNIKWLKDLNNEAHEIYEKINQSYRVRFPKMNEDGSWPENDHTFPESYLFCHRLSTTELRHRNFKDSDTVYVTFDGQVVLENNTHYAYRIKADGRICIYTSESGWLDITEDYENGKEKKMYNDTLYVRKSKDKKLELEWECKNKVMRTWSNFFYSIYRFFHTLDSIYMCLRFPFLYPRNRWTGRHYNNWKLSNYCKKIREKNRAFLNIVVPEDQSSIPQFAIPALPSPVSLPEDIRDEEFKSYDWCVRLNGGAENQYYLSSTDGNAAYRPVWHLGSLKVYHATFGWITLPYFEAKDTSDGNIFKRDCIFYHEDEHEYAWHYTYVHNRWKERWCKIVDWFNYNFLGFIFGIPTHSEIDAMDEGWMRAFGMDLLKELKTQLKKDKYLYKYRITQIKEKYGMLCIYDGGATKEVHDLLSKYESLSEHTCIYCGRPAKYITTGYVLPYCENCISEESKIGAYILDESGKVIYDPYEEEREEGVSESNAESKG